MRGLAASESPRLQAQGAGQAAHPLQAGAVVARERADECRSDHKGQQ